ncbi:hypothetical protein MKX01_034140 [Papaver californicum]|nr:hypothetical protein MKX01_034140 [Papaver californicum]
MEKMSSSFQDLEAAGTTFSSGRQKNPPPPTPASGVFQINTSVSTFHRLINTLGTPKDTPQLRRKLRNTRSHITQLVKDTSAKLKQACNTATKKIADVNLAKDFELVLKEFQKAQHVAAKREVQYDPFVPSSYSRNDTNFEQRAALIESTRQDALILDDEIVLNEAIIEEREQGIQELQNQIDEVNDIFKDLAVLVHKQGDGINDIDSHVDDSYMETQQAKSQLEKAVKTQKSSSSQTSLLLVISGIYLLIMIIVLTA